MTTTARILTEHKTATPISSPAAVRPADAWQPALVQAGMAGIWLGCLVIGILGLLLPYPRHHLPSEPAPVLALNIKADLPAPPAPDPHPIADAVPAAAVVPKAEAEPPPPAEIAPLPEAAPLLAVAAPSPAIAFAVPVDAPARVVDAKQAQPPPVQAAPVPPPRPSRPPVQHLTFGVGQGQQPNPDYPREAVLARQTGSVKVRFTVNAEGRVVAAELAAGCRWPLLNQAALRAIRERWRFVPGDVRSFEVSIEFELNG